MFAKFFVSIIMQYVSEGSGSWKYNHYFPVAEDKEKKLNLFFLNHVNNYETETKGVEQIQHNAWHIYLC